MSTANKSRRSPATRAPHAALVGNQGFVAVKTFREELGLNRKQFARLTAASERAVADYFEAVVEAGADPKAAANWVMTESLGGYNAAGRFAVPAVALASLLGLVRDGTVSHQAAKRVFAELDDGADPRAVAERLGLLQVRDESLLETWVDEVLAAHPREVERYRAGEAKLLGFLTGQVMRRSQGKADPKGVQPVLLRRLGRP